MGIVSIMWNERLVLKRKVCVGVNSIGLYDVAGAHELAGGHVWGLIGLGCMMWQEHMSWQVAMCGG